MTQKNDDQKKQPWEASFSEENSPEESAAPSRTQFRKRSSRTAWIVSLLILAVVVLAAYPVVRYVESINASSSSADEPTQTQISTTTPSKSSHKAASAKSKSDAADAQSKADASSVAAASSQAVANSRAAASSAAVASSQAAKQSSIDAAKAAESAKQADSSSSSSSADSSSSSSADGQYDTVKVNGYRLALAHGMSLSELQALNPGVDLNNVHVGESLRVK